MTNYKHSLFLEDRKLKKEILLDEICEYLQLDKTRIERMEKAYDTVSTILEKSDFFGVPDCLIYAYGSRMLGTTTKPYKKEEYDLDWIVQIEIKSKNIGVQEFIDILYNILNDDERYNGKLKKLRYCVRIDYAGDFHMDIMPAFIAHSADNHIIVPDTKKGIMIKRNPKGYIAWFSSLFIADFTKLSLLDYYKFKYEIRAETESLPQAVPYQYTQPIQRTVQLIKRARDIYFENDRTLATSSVILTTLVGRLYRGETSILGTMNGIVDRLTNELNSHSYPNIMTVYNPADDHLPISQREKLSDKWEDGLKGRARYNAFKKFVDWLDKSWHQFESDQDDPYDRLVSLFGKKPSSRAIEERSVHLNRLKSKGLVGYSAISNSLTSNISIPSFREVKKNTNDGQIF